MMRKLLVLVAILAMAPVASAVTGTLTDTGTGVELSIGDPLEDAYLAIVSDAGVLSNFAAGPDAPSVQSSFGATTVNGQDGEVWGLGTGAGETHMAGVWLTADWSSLTEVWVRAYQTYDTVNWILLDEIKVPEPMTVALLGLGGLFMLRRRK
jgi:hypothetical protein